VSTIYVVALIFGVATARVRMRDERGRLRSGTAALASVLALVLVGVVLTVLFE
jgi:predicted nucleic acid-binding Zn ribbon protein